MLLDMDTYRREMIEKEKAIIKAAMEASGLCQKYADAEQKHLEKIRCKHLIQTELKAGTPLQDLMEKVEAYALEQDEQVHE